MGWAFDLDVAAGLEVDVFARRQLEHQLLDERGHVAVRPDRALPRFTSKISAGTSIFMSCLTGTWQVSRMPSRTSLRVMKSRSVGRMSPPPSSNLAPALAAGSPAAAGRREKDVRAGQRPEQFSAGGDRGPSCRRRR